ncbi:tetratricopeptide repeat protein [Streptomyces sp. NPDC000070]|uniref:tetratricopeptide repeat protein n=1 Tax=Streptomyces sp. NPDC000070 TaxID=3154240 RepID=UPI00331CC065
MFIMEENWYFIAHCTLRPLVGVDLSDTPPLVPAKGDGSAPQGDKAIAFYQAYMRRARAVGAKEEEAKAANNMGLWLRWRGRLDQAVDAFTRSASLAHSAGDNMLEYVALHNHANLLIIAGRLDKGGRSLKERAARVAEQSKKQLTFVFFDPESDGQERVVRLPRNTRKLGAPD